MSIVDPFHPPLQFYVSFKATKVLDSNVNDRFCFYKADYVKINNELNSLCWENEFSGCPSVNDMVTIFYTHV